jgi:hypothetical protein
LAHGKHPSFANLNHVTGDSGIPRESPNRRVGIRRVRAVMQGKAPEEFV